MKTKSGNFLNKSYTIFKVIERLSMKHKKLQLTVGECSLLFEQQRINILLDICFFFTTKRYFELETLGQTYMELLARNQRIVKRHSAPCASIMVKKRVFRDTADGS